MGAVLVAVVLIGAALVVAGSRRVVQRWTSAGKDDVDVDGKGGVLILAGALVVIVATPPMLNHLYPEGTTQASAAPTPSVMPSATDMGAHDQGAPAGAEASPSPTEEASSSPVPAPAEAAPPPSSPAPAPRRTTTRSLARGRTGGTSGTTAPASPSAAPVSPPAPEPTRALPEPPVPPGSPAPPAPQPPGSPPLSPQPPVASPSPPPSPTPVFVVTVTCSGLHSKMKRGDHFTMTYDFDSTSARMVGVATALVDSDGDDRSDGSGSKDSVAVAAGHTKLSRRVDLASDLPRRTLEAIGQVWPEHHVGDRNAKVIAEGSCGRFEVTD